MRPVLQHACHCGPHTLCRIAVDWYGWLNAITSKHHYDHKSRMLSVLFIFLTKQNAYLMPNEACQRTPPHFHEYSLEKTLSWTDHVKKRGLTTWNGFNKLEMILHFDLHVARLSKMGRLALGQTQKNIFYLINLEIVYKIIFRSWSWRHARALLIMISLKSAKTKRFHEACTRSGLQLPILKSLYKDACNLLSTNFSIRDTIKNLPKLPISESITFSGVWKVLGLLLVYLPRMPHHRGLFSTKAFKNLFAYN